MTQSPKIQKPKRKEKLSDKEQSERFNETVRELGADLNRSEFEKSIGIILKPKNLPNQ